MINLAAILEDAKSDAGSALERMSTWARADVLTELIDEINGELSDPELSGMTQGRREGLLHSLRRMEKKRDVVLEAE